MLSSVHYQLKTTSQTENMVNAIVTYDVYYDINQGIAYEVELKAPATDIVGETPTIWHAKIVNDQMEKRLEYDLLQRIYYQTKQTIKVESALYNLQDDLRKFLASSNVKPIGEITGRGWRQIPGLQVEYLKHLDRSPTDAADPPD